MGDLSSMKPLGTCGTGGPGGGLGHKGEDLRALLREDSFSVASGRCDILSNSQGHEQFPGAQASSCRWLPPEGPRYGHQLSFWGSLWLYLCDGVATM